MQVAAGRSEATVSSGISVRTGQRSVIILEDLVTREQFAIPCQDVRERRLLLRLLSRLLSIGQRQAADRYRRRPVAPIPKRRQELRAVTPPPGKAVCPACLNDSEQVVWCDVCDGAGLVQSEDLFDA